MSEKRDCSAAVRDSPLVFRIYVLILKYINNVNETGEALRKKRLPERIF